MDYQRFLQTLPSLYENWGRDTVQPRSPRFAELKSQVRGMTTPNVLQLLNFAVACLEDDECYCEVGCYQGATLVGALDGHPHCQALAADNFSEFDKEGQNHPMLLKNLEAFGLNDQVDFHNQDFAEFLVGLRERKPRIGVYLYDGAHDYRSQLLGLLLAVPLLAPRALLIVDDSNWQAVKQGTWDFLAARPEARLLLELPTPVHAHQSFWNGLQVLSWDARACNVLDRDFLRRRREALVLESLTALQQINVKIEEDRIFLSRADGREGTFSWAAANPNAVK